MRYASGHKHNTKQSIIRSACKLFVAKGFDATSIEEIMRDCNLTRGGFYAHFKSKSQLYRDAIGLVASQSELSVNRSGRRNEDDWIESLLSEYLNEEQAINNNSAPHLVFLATDVTSADPEVRTAYADAFKAMSAQIFNRISSRCSCNEESILSIAAMIVGAMAIAQTIDDSVLKKNLLASCKANAKAMLENGNDKSLSFFWEIPLDRDHRRSKASN